jgi:polyhydroxyalkanoate synthesis regulator phasin
MRLRVATIASLLAGLLIGAGTAHAQLPGGMQVPGGVQIPTSLPGKDQLLTQAKQMVEDLTSLKGSGKLAPEQAKKVDDDLLPRANSLTSDLAKPQVETSKLTQYARDLSDLQKQVTSLKSLVK